MKACDFWYTTQWTQVGGHGCSPSGPQTHKKGFDSSSISKWHPFVLLVVVQNALPKFWPHLPLYLHEVLLDPTRFAQECTTAAHTNTPEKNICHTTLGWVGFVSLSKTTKKNQPCSSSFQLSHSSHLALLASLASVQEASLFITTEEAGAWATAIGKVGWKTQPTKHCNRNWKHKPNSGWTQLENKQKLK